MPPAPIATHVRICMTASQVILGYPVRASLSTQLSMFNAAPRSALKPLLTACTHPTTHTHTHTRTQACVNKHTQAHIRMKRKNLNRFITVKIVVSLHIATALNAPSPGHCVSDCSSLPSCSAASNALLLVLMVLMQSASVSVFLSGLARQSKHYIDLRANVM